MSNQSNNSTNQILNDTSSLQVGPKVTWSRNDVYKTLCKVSDIKFIDFLDDNNFQLIKETLLKIKGPNSIHTDPYKRNKWDLGCIFANIQSIILRTKLQIRAMEAGTYRTSVMIFRGNQRYSDPMVPAIWEGKLKALYKSELEEFLKLLYIIKTNYNEVLETWITVNNFH